MLRDPSVRSETNYDLSHERRFELENNGNVDGEFDVTFGDEDESPSKSEIKASKKVGNSYHLIQDSQSKENSISKSEVAVYL